MPTVFESISDGFYTAFLEPDPDKRKEKIETWIKDSTSVIQSAVENDLRAYIDDLLADTWTEKGWINRARKYYSQIRKPGSKSAADVIPSMDAYKLHLDLKILLGSSKDMIIDDLIPEVRKKTNDAIEKAKTEIAKLDPPAPVQLREIDLHEYTTVEEAIASVEKFLNDSLRDNVRRVRIIHGKGEGVLREAVRECLDKHPFVMSLSILLADGQHGGEGATEANLVTFKPELLD
jgi:DNA-nicking Smr family endonuclease